MHRRIQATWLSQANQAFGTPASMLAHGFSRESCTAGTTVASKHRNFCFNAPADQMQIRNLMEVVKNYISDRDPDLGPAQGVIQLQ